MPCSSIAKYIKAEFANMARSIDIAATLFRGGGRRVQRHAPAHRQSAFVGAAERSTCNGNGQRIEVWSDAGIAALLVGHSDEDLLSACTASRRAGGADDFSVIVLARQH